MVGSLKGVNIFVSGGTGVVGSRAVRLLVEDGHRVSVLARSPSKGSALEDLGASPVYAGLFEPDKLGDAIPGHHAVVNLATHIPRSFVKMGTPGAWSENDRIRREGSRNLVDAASNSGIEVYIQESITFGYPDCGDEWIDETIEWSAASNLRSAQEAESQAERFTNSGKKGIVLRFALFYAADSSHTEDTARMARRGIYPAVGRKDAYQSSIHADDAARAVVAALSAPAGTYNVGDDEPLTRRDAAEAISKVLGVGTLKIPPTWLAKLGGSKAATLARSQRVSNRKFKQATGWSPKYLSLREGWKEVAEQLTKA